MIVTLAYMSIIMNIQPRSERGQRHEAERQDVQYVSNKYGNRQKETVTIATVWAYFRQLSGNEIYRVTTQTTEEVMFVINYRTDIATENVILYKDVQYNIVRVDVFEGYKSDLTLYCKKKP